MNYTYMLRCGDGSFYTGWTNDIRQRLENHRSGKGAKYTRGRGPLELVYLEEFETKSEAMRREAYIKRLSRAEKLELLAGHSPVLPAASRTDPAGETETAGPENVGR